MKNYLLNCFCKKNSNVGNPATVILEFDGDNVAKQKLAKEINTPVTVFISDISMKEPRLEYFYPHTEMPLCLHGTLAAACVMLNKTHDVVIHFKTALNQKLTVMKSATNCFQVKVSAADFPTIKLTADLVTRLLNIDANIILKDLPFTIASVGSPKLLIPINSLEILNNLKPNFELIKEWSIAEKINGLYVYTRDKTDFTYHARGFNTKTGHNEDAATGVAAAALASVLKHDIIIEQGSALNMSCSIIVTYQNPENIWVGGDIYECSLN